MTIEISSRHAMLFVYLSGALSMMAVIFGWQLAAATHTPTLADTLGCLPGTQPVLTVEVIGDRRDNIIVKCVEVRGDG